MFATRTLKDGIEISEDLGIIEAIGNGAAIRRAKAVHAGRFGWVRTRDGWTMASWKVKAVLVKSEE